MAFLLRNPTDPGAASAISRIVPRPPAVQFAIAIAAHNPTPPVSHVPPPVRQVPITPVSRVPAGKTLPPLGNGFVSVPVVKARLTNLVTRKAQIFQFNPTEISRKDGWDWASHKIPGASHPIISGGSGGARTISFVLYFDAERGRSAARSHSGNPNVTGATNEETSLDLTSELNAYRQYTYPANASRNGIPERGPARALFNCGPFFQNVLVGVRASDVNVTTWTPQMAPMRATINIEMEEIVQRSLFVQDLGHLLETGSDISSEQLDLIRGSDLTA